MLESGGNKMSLLNGGVISSPLRCTQIQSYTFSAVISQPSLCFQDGTSGAPDNIASVSMQNGCTYCRKASNVTVWLLLYHIIENSSLALWNLLQCRLWLFTYLHLFYLQYKTACDMCKNKCSLHKLHPPLE